MCGVLADAIPCRYYKGAILINNCCTILHCMWSRVAQWKRAGPITQRPEDQSSLCYISFGVNKIWRRETVLIKRKLLQVLGNKDLGFQLNLIFKLQLHSLNNQRYRLQSFLLKIIYFKLYLTLCSLSLSRNRTVRPFHKTGKIKILWLN